MRAILRTPSLSVGSESKLEFLGFVTAVCGTALISFDIGAEFLGFVLYGLSNIAWTRFAMSRAYKWLLCQNVIFMLFTIIGLIRFWPIS